MNVNYHTTNPDFVWRLFLDFAAALSFVSPARDSNSASDFGAKNGNPELRLGKDLSLIIFLTFSRNLESMLNRKTSTLFITVSIKFLIVYYLWPYLSSYSQHCSLTSCCRYWHYYPLLQLNSSWIPEMTPWTASFCPDPAVTFSPQGLGNWPCSSLEWLGNPTAKRFYILISYYFCHLSTLEGIMSLTLSS